MGRVPEAIAVEATAGSRSGPAAAAQAQAQTSEFPPVAHYMWRRYFNRSTTCPTYSGAPAQYNAAAANLPLTECVGIILRFTSRTSEPDGGWIPEAKSLPGAQPAGGGVSAIFIRTDAKFTWAPWGDTHGFTLYPNQGKYGMPAGKQAVTPLCGYPYDGGTDGRTNGGCGPKPGATVGGPCAPPTADAWRQTYFKGGMGGQCSFDLSGSDAASAFRELLEGISPSLMGSALDNVKWKENELRLATWGTDDPSSAALPVESFFYMAGTSDGLAGAQYDQLQYYKKTGQFVPIVQITQLSSLMQDYQFHYHSADQNKNEDVPIPKTFARLPCTPGDFDPKNWKVDTDGECSF
jgi:hypothetical protein